LCHYSGDELLNAIEKLYKSPENMQLNILYQLFQLVWTFHLVKVQNKYW